ncbi:general odorant-binding protein 45-like [Uranotaenia lowii]|uniref:general odorant-binding protein 45-like n=1 Tax=Uranotaenia lowii TaxID=190385 RepID=UPI002478BADB|nr:general odorant-binding protein 45-like [Uranotaenia lowii]
MYCFFTLLLLVATTAQASHRHCLQYKKPSALLNEPLLIFGQNSDPCHLRSSGIIARIWNSNNATADSKVIPRFWYLKNSSEEFNALVTECLRKVEREIPVDQECRRAVEMFNCYNGTAELRMDEPVFIPRTELQHARVLSDCSRMLQISRSELDLIRKEGLLNHPKGRCLVRCFLLREDLFCEATGIRAFRIMVQGGGADDGIEFRKQGERCIARLQRNFLDRCTLAARIANECYDQTLLKMIHEGLKYL